MNTAHTITLIGILAFAFGSSLVPSLRAAILHDAESHKTISDGLTGPWHWFESAGFIALAVALGLLGYLLDNGATMLAWLVGVGVFGAMATDTLRPWVRKLFNLTNSQCERHHIQFAALAFGGALFLMIALSWLSRSNHRWVLWALTAWYPVSVGVVRLIWPPYTAWQEKTAALAIVEFFVAWCLLA
ncbi:MAG TPA: hypothetical protein VFA48_03025 [Gammaproteobacteria bacterium]|nr:hypothetical protein [Gammaproteobacteria bacterium]